MPTSLLFKILAGALALAALLWLIQSRDHWRDEANANLRRWNDERAAHVATVANYRAAAEEARAADKANLERVRAEQASINERTAHDYESRLAVARASLDRLRAHAAASADSGSSGSTPVSGVSTPTCGADAPTDDPVARAYGCAIQLDELIRWVKRQAGVDVGNPHRPLASPAAASVEKPGAPLPQ